MTNNKFEWQKISNGYIASIGKDTYYAPTVEVLVLVFILVCEANFTAEHIKTMLDTWSIELVKNVGMLQITAKKKVAAIPKDPAYAWEVTNVEPTDATEDKKPGVKL